jgi:anti-anti-sigma factor
MIRAHEDPAVLTLDVAGPATMMESPVVNDAASERLASGVRALCVDLRDCTAMDSTFSGTLLSLKRQLEHAGGTLTLVSPSPTVLALLKQMGLEDFYTIDVADRVQGSWDEIRPKTPSTDKLRRLILDAHDELACVPGLAADAFRPVAEELHRDDDRPSGAHA